MSSYLIRITTGQQVRELHGIFASSVDALLHGLDICGNPNARVSAKPLRKS